MNRSFWKGKKVLVTGHTGFKGSWLSLWLQRIGADVSGYALPPPTTPSLFEIANVSGGMKSIVGDVRDFERMKRVITDHDPEIIIHMAAQSMVRYSYGNPVETYSTNVMGTVNLLEAVRQAGRPRVVVNVTTDKCYENREWVWGYRESDLLGGRDPYSNSKACAEIVTSGFRSSYFRPEEYEVHKVAIASARAGNVLGGGDWTSDQLVPDIIRAFMAEKPVLIRSPKAIRPWQFVLDPLNGYLTLAEHLSNQGATYSEAFNFGPYSDDMKPVSWIVERLSTRWGDGARWEVDGAGHPHEAHFLKLDSTKAREMLSWAPKLALPQAIEWVVEWYRAFHDNKDIRGLTETQIARYETLPGMRSET